MYLSPPLRGGLYVAPARRGLPQWAEYLLTYLDSLSRTSEVGSSDHAARHDGLELDDPDDV